MMARGWESKSVEEQQSEARTASPARRLRSPEEVAREEKGYALKLSRSRIVQQLESAHNPNYRRMLEAALADLDRQLSSQDESQA
jgi:hypothetical protein